MAEVTRTSRYRRVRLVKYKIYEDGETDQARFSRIDVAFEPRYTSVKSDGTFLYTVKAGETLPMLARRFFGRSNLWHTIADHNPVDAFYPLEIEPLTVLEIPPVEVVGLVPSQL